MILSGLHAKKYVFSSSVFFVCLVQIPSFLSQDTFTGQVMFTEKLSDLKQDTKCQKQEKCSQKNKFVFTLSELKFYFYYFFLF